MNAPSLAVHPASDRRCWLLVEPAGTRRITARPSAHARAHRRAHARGLAVVDRRACGSRARTGSRSSSSPRACAPSPPTSRRRPTCCAASATGSSTAPTGSATRSTRLAATSPTSSSQTASFAFPVLALVAAAIVRWRHRAYFVLLVAGRHVVAVGAWPYDDPSSYGALWKSFAERHRGRPRAPQHAARRTAARPRSRRARSPRGVAVVSRASAGVAAGRGRRSWSCRRAHRRSGTDGYLSTALERAGGRPGVLGRGDRRARPRRRRHPRAGDPGHRLRRLPMGQHHRPDHAGADRSAVRRARGAPVRLGRRSVNLLDALDRRIQEGTFEPDALAPSPGCSASGRWLVRVRPRVRALRHTCARDALAAAHRPGPRGTRRADREFGPATRNRRTGRLPGRRSAGSPHCGRRRPIRRPGRVVRRRGRGADRAHRAPARSRSCSSGDGDGIVDAAAAGSSTDAPLVLDSAALTPTQRRARVAPRVPTSSLTDSNRRRSQLFFVGVRDNYGDTERAGQDVADPTGSTFRLDPFTGAGDDATHRGRAAWRAPSTPRRRHERPGPRPRAPSTGIPGPRGVVGADPRRCNGS